VFIAFESGQRSALVIGFVYFGIYLLSSYASRNAGSIGRQFGDVAQAINVTFLIGAGLLLVAGAASWLNLPVLSIVVFLGLYLLHNVRKPLNVAFMSDQISSDVMASGLSVESQLVTLLMAVIAPVLGVLADVAGIGSALALLGLVMGGVALVTHVGSRRDAEAAQIPGV
jgi:hypothetical protein